MTRITRRTILKTVHWIMLPLLVWFVLVGPPEAMALGSWGFRFHSNLALLFVILCLAWTGDFVWRGMATTRTPRLPGWAKRFHWWLHRIIVWSLFVVALTGFLLGLTSSRLLKAGGFLPIAPPLGMKEANAWVGLVHIVEFYGLALLVAVHAAFHIWRHVKLKDNALRVMVPKPLHRFL